MRVLHIGKYFLPFAGGIEYFLADLLPALEQQGVQAAALVHEHPNTPRKPPVFKIPLDPTVPVYRAPCYGQMLYAPISPQFPLWLTRVIGEFRPDIIHLHMPNTSAFWVLLMASARRIPWIIHWHADVVPSHIDRRLTLAYQLYRPLERCLLAKSRAIIATSPPYLASSKALQPWRTKCHVIPIGLNPQRIFKLKNDALSRTANLWDKTFFRVLSIGRLTYYKGHELLIQAATKIPNLRLIIVGQGERQARLKQLVSSLKLEQSVKLVGFQTEAELNALFATCDVVCLPSLERTEAFGLVLVEAMCFQKPIVASDIPGSGVGWVVQQGGHGLLVKPNDRDALTKTLVDLAQSPRQRQALGQAGSRALQKIFHINQVAAKTISLYQTVYQSFY